MKIAAKAAPVLLVAIFAAYPALAEEPAAPGPQAEVVRGNNQFAWDLYAKLREAEGNLFFSPYSISTALAMTYAGARGETAEQMAETLHFTAPDEVLHRAMGALVGDLNTAGDGDSYELMVANALWGQSGYEFLDAFTEMVEESYGAGLKNVDFQRAAEQAARDINAWVAEQTNNRIRDIIQARAIDSLTVLVLTNAIYFKADWKPTHQFRVNATEDKPFTLADGEKIDVPMMYQKKLFQYGENDDCQIIELPYEADRLSMFVLLPRKVGDLPALEAKLSPESLEDWTGGMRRREVRLYLPRFTMTSEFSLKDVLSAMGMRDAFSRNADFSGMSGRGDPIRAVVHKAFVDVNERGTEAAATGRVAVVGFRSIGDPPVFRADHPFLFLIRDNETDSILFIGRVANPKAE